MYFLSGTYIFLSKYTDIKMKLLVVSGLKLVFF